MIKTVFLAGPTAVGKTEYAIKLAQDLNGEIVSADSMQIYKYMDIGSAKPTKEEQKQAVHHLIDEIDPRTAFNVSDYQSRAIEYIKDISERGKLPIVAGGTGLYINSLIYDMDFSAPESNYDKKDEILHRFGSDSVKLHEYLKELDPKAAELIHPNNVKRVLRYIERIECGEESLAKFAEADAPSTILEPILTGLRRDRSSLYERIDRRVDKLMDQGLADEVKGLMAMGFTSDDIAMKGIGYKELIDAFSGKCSIEEAVTQIKFSTHHLAKRQFSWFNRYKDLYWVDIDKEEFDDEAYIKLKEYIEERLNG